MPNNTLIAITITEQDVRDIINGANGGNAIGECPMNENVAAALVAEFADVIFDDVLQYAEGVVARLADRHARITDPIG